MSLKKILPHPLFFLLVTTFFSTMSKVNPKTRLEDEEKRNIPPALKKVLEIDVKLTKKFVSALLNFVPFRSLKTHCKFLEYSCHGIVWLAGWLAYCWLLDNKDNYQMQINMIFGLLIDIVFVALIKAATRRRRPTLEEDFFSLGPDKFSFPSGHASRAFYILCFFTILHPLSLIFWPPLFAWAFSVALSRLLLYRHHILDVCSGMILGVLEALLLGVLWLSSDTSYWIMTWMTEDYVPGGSEDST